ncbi:hypothetical protein LSAT2_006355, partial [Lamellibrachia satsuma]
HVNVVAVSRGLSRDSTLSLYPGGYQDTQRCRSIKGAIKKVNVVAVYRGLSRDSTLSPCPGGNQETQRREADSCK